MINLGALTKLKKFGSLTTHSIDVSHVIEIAEIFGKQVDKEMAASLLNAFQQDAVEPMVDWCVKEENIQKLQTLMSPKAQRMLVDCPHCGELSTFQFGEVAPLNPHVICRICSKVIPVEE
jgi:ribosomal protein S27E